jgi:protein tyrosine/serine phosphatase
LEILFLKGSHGDTLPANISKVEDTQLGCELFRSGIPQLHHLDYLKALGIERIISLMGCPTILEIEIQKKGFHHLNINPGLRHITPEKIEAVIDTLRQNTRATLLHCMAGSDRSGIVIAALRAQQGWGLARIREEMFQHIHITWPKYRYFFDRLLPHFLDAQLANSSSTDSCAGADGGLHR